MNASSPNPLRALLPIAGRALQEALNRALALDPDARSQLLALSGRVVELQLEAPALAMRISVTAAGLVVGPAQAESEADLSLRATAGALLERLRISGDAELARQLQKLVASFDPDFDAAFARGFGEILGPQIAKALRTAWSSGQAHARHFAEDTAEYLVEERRDVVSRVEQEIFFDEVDDLRDAVERLEARIRRLPGRRPE